MTDPTIDPHWFEVAWKWLAGAGTAVWSIWKYVDAKIVAMTTANDARHDKAEAAIKSLADIVTDRIDHETRCVRIELKGKVDKDDFKEMLARIDKINGHVEKLYINAEADRAKSRDFHDQAMQTMTQQHTKILEAMAGLQGGRR